MATRHFVSSARLGFPKPMNSAARNCGQGYQSTLNWGLGRKSLNEVNISLTAVIEPTLHLLHVCHNLRQQLIKFMSSFQCSIFQIEAMK